METSTVTVRIVEPHRAYARYELDGGAVRLRAIGYPQEAGPADLAVIPGTAQPEGDALEVLLLGDVAHPPDCLVDAAPVGVLTCRRDGHSAPYILAVAGADPAAARAEGPGALPEGWRACLERSFGEAELCWGGRAEAWAAIREARQAARLARAAGARGPAGPAWLPDRADQPAAGPEAAETARHSRAEYSFHGLPLRFQKYVADYLTPAERVRFFVLRPRMASALQRGWLRRAQLAEGFLILTTEQLLFLEEVLPPDVTEMPYGYLVRSIPVERLSEVALEERGASLRLGWATATADGVAWTDVEFPGARRSELGALCAQLTAYLPRADDRRLQRIYAPEAVAPDLRDPAANEPGAAAPVVARLTARLGQTLLPGEDVLAQAFIPAWFEHSGGVARLLVVTGERVLVVPDDEHAAAAAYPLARIASLELRASILGSWLSLAMPDGEGVRRAEIRFPSTGFGFQACYRTLRQVLANPPATAKRQRP